LSVDIVHVWDFWEGGPPLALWLSGGLLHYALERFWPAEAWSESTYACLSVALCKYGLLGRGPLLALWLPGGLLPCGVESVWPAEAWSEYVLEYTAACRRREPGGLGLWVGGRVCVCVCVCT